MHAIVAHGIQTTRRTAAKYSKGTRMPQAQYNTLPKALEGGGGGARGQNIGVATPPQAHSSKMRTRQSSFLLRLPWAHFY